MAKFFIITRPDFCEEFEADSAKEAAINWYPTMDAFDIIPENEYESYMLNRSLESSKREFLDFAKDVIEDDLEITNEEAVEEIANIAWEKYTGRDSDKTQYQCIELAADEWIEENEDE